MKVMRVYERIRKYLFIYCVDTTGQNIPSAADSALGIDAPPGSIKLRKPLPKTKLESVFLAWKQSIIVLQLAGDSIHGLHFLDADFFKET